MIAERDALRAEHLLSNRRNSRRSSQYATTSNENEVTNAGELEQKSGGKRTKNQSGFADLPTQVTSGRDAYGLEEVVPDLYDIDQDFESKEDDLIEALNF